MLNFARASKFSSKQSYSKVPTEYRPLKVFEGDHKLTRQYHIWHYTNDMAANEIMKTGKLNPGDGNHGKGIYFTSMNPYLFSKDEIKLLLRNTKISDECISANIGIDTDDLDKKGIKYVVKPNNTVFIPTETPLDIKGIAKRDDTPLEKAE